MAGNLGLLLEILSPEGEVFKDTVREVTLPTVQGEITVLPGHAPLFAKLGEGEIVIREGNESSFVCVTGGFLEVSGNRVNVLASFAIRSEEIEARKAEEARKKAEALLKNRQDKREFATAESDLKKSLLELKIAEKYRKRRTRQPGG